MRIANLAGRAVVRRASDHWVDVHHASDGAFGPGPAAVLDRWEEFVAWAAGADLDAAGAVDVDVAAFEAPSPAPRQIFAAGLNYREHAAESGFDIPVGLPPIFTKFASCLSGPVTQVSLPPGGHTDWEVEVAVIIGRTAHDVDPADAWQYVAGLTASQDLSERITQLQGPAPQFGLGKSFPGFLPMGPWLVTPDEFVDPDDIGIEARLDGEVVQQGRTSQMIFPVPHLVAGLSRVVTLFPGDVILTGTPAGVGLGRDPQRFIRPGEELVTWVEGIGELRQVFVDPQMSTTAAVRGEVAARR